ncbi:hypothetical protein [Propioniciclava flava]
MALNRNNRGAQRSEYSGYLIMAFTRRTAVAIAAATVLMLVLPLLNSFKAVSAWAPTALLGAATLDPAKLAPPLLSAVIVTAGCLFIASIAVSRQSLRRDA